MDQSQATGYATALRAKAAELRAELNNRDGLVVEIEPDVFGFSYTPKPHRLLKRQP